MWNRFVTLLSEVCATPDPPRARTGASVFRAAPAYLRYRLTLWLSRDEGREVDAELYDYEKDPGETENLAKSAAHSKVVADLRAQFARGWRGAVPAGK